MTSECSIYNCILYRYCICLHVYHRDLAIKHMFDSHPVLWQCLLLLANSTLTTESRTGQASSGPFVDSESSCSGTSALVTCAPLVRSLLTVLTQHWQRCCVESTSAFKRELSQSVFIMECMARVSSMSDPLIQTMFSL